MPLLVGYTTFQRYLLHMSVYAWCTFNFVLLLLLLYCTVCNLCHFVANYSCLNAEKSLFPGHFFTLVTKSCRPNQLLRREHDFPYFVSFLLITLSFLLLNKLRMEKYVGNHLPRGNMERKREREIMIESLTAGVISSAAPGNKNKTFLLLFFPFTVLEKKRFHFYITHTHRKKNYYITVRKQEKKEQPSIITFSTGQKWVDFTLRGFKNRYVSSSSHLLLAFFR